ncbi:MAG: lycopene cyclase domain-containing protein [Haloarculaceae archaeon]
MSPLTYLEFHAVFLVPPLLVLGWAATRPRWRRYRSLPGGCEVRPIAVTIVLAIALASTTPWDNYRIDIGVWTLAENHTTGLVLLGLPVEEGLFFLATSLFVVQGLLLFPWTRRRWL